MIKVIICDRICKTIAHFSNSCLLNIYNLLSQVYPLAKFQLHKPIALEVTALQSSNNRKINLYSKYGENKLQVPTKMVVTYQRIEVWSYNFHHRVRLEQGNQLLGRSFLYSPFFTAYKGGMREEKSITYDRFDVAQTNAYNFRILGSTATKQRFSNSF